MVCWRSQEERGRCHDGIDGPGEAVERQDADRWVLADSVGAGQKTMEKNNFEVLLVESGSEAKRIVMEDLLPGTGAKRIAWGGTMTMEEIGLGEALRQRTDLTQIDPMAQGPMPDMDHLRKAFNADLFFSGTNAVTEAGQLVNLDMLGNRIAAITFGPTHVVILVGRTRSCPTSKPPSIASGTTCHRPT